VVSHFAEKIEKLNLFPHSLHHRASSHAQHAHSFRCDFLPKILSHRPNQWIQMSPMSSQNIFNHEILLIPFTSAKYKSMFAVIGANEIKNYAKIGHMGSTPCIVHLDALPASKSCHDANFIGNKIRSFLNAMWSHRNLGTRDPELNPFNKRSMPLIRLNNCECCVQIFSALTLSYKSCMLQCCQGQLLGAPTKAH
jgi:hypothetical protein